jgi:hypothetical protein
VLPNQRSPQPTSHDVPHPFYVVVDKSKMVGKKEKKEQKHPDRILSLKEKQAK